MEMSMESIRESGGPRLGAKVRALRRRENLNQVQLAERLGISASYLNLIESNKRPLPAALLIRLAQLFNVDLHSFATDKTRGWWRISSRCSPIRCSKGTD